MIASSIISLVNCVAVLSSCTCMMRDEVTMGLIPSSIRVPEEIKKIILMIARHANGNQQSCIPSHPPTSIVGRDDPQPVERISTVRRHDTKQRNLKNRTKYHKSRFMITSSTLLKYIQQMYIQLHRQHMYADCENNVSYKELFSFTIQTQEVLKLSEALLCAHMYMYIYNS